MRPAPVLDQQIEFYSNQAERAEDLWQADHEAAMQCCDVEDLIELGLAMLNSIRRRNQSWDNSIRESKEAFSWDDSERFATAFQLWTLATRRILRLAQYFESKGFEVRGAAMLGDAFRHVSLLSFDVKRLRASFESLEQGRGIPREKALNELRDHLRRRGT
jgi:hypothetical protein